MKYNKYGKYLQTSVFAPCAACCGGPLDVEGAGPVAEGTQSVNISYVHVSLLTLLAWCY